jgi:hypothetical protein
VEYLKDLCELWLKELRRCRKHKATQFGDTAELLRGFMGKSYRELYIDTANADLKTDDVPYFQPRLAKTREFVSVVTPFVHAKIPNRLVSPRRPPLPPALLTVAGLGESHAQASMEDKAQAHLSEWFLNYIPGEYGAKRQQRQVIEECLVTGRGVGWHEMTTGPTGQIPGTFFDTVDNLFIDADCSQWREASFIIRKRRWPAWKLADMFSIPVHKIRAAKKEGSERAAEEGQTTVGVEDSDLCTWYEVWSRMGMGNRLYKADETLRDRAEALESLGQHIWLAIMPGLDYPLNLPDDLWEVANVTEIKSRLEWPIAFFEESSNPWPCTPCDIYPCTDSAWATSPLEGAIPLQVFLDRMYALLMGRVRSTCRDIILTSKELEPLVEQAIKEGRDQIVVACEGDTIPEMERLVHILQFPEINADAWRILHQVERAFEQSTGMDPLLYGSEGSRQIRSAEEVNVRSSNVQSRPGDYADAVEEYNSQSAVKELQMSRLYVQPSTVAPLFRETPTEDETQYGPLTLLWASLVNTPDPAEAVADLHVQVEAGSGMRKNRQKMAADLQSVGQILVPVLQEFAAAGVVQPFNAFLDVVAETHEMPLDAMKLPEMSPQAQQGEGEDDGERQSEEAEKDREAKILETVLNIEGKLEEARIKAKASSSGGG